MSMSIGKQLGASITGNVESACLVMHDYRALGDVQEKTDTGFSTKSFLTDTEKLSTMKAIRTADTQSALATGVNFPTYQGSQDKFFYVQFNPSQLSLNVTSPTTDLKDIASDKSRSMAASDSSLSMTTTLYFDDMRIYDAFMWEKFTAGLTAQGIANLANFIQEGRGKVWTVQTQVEGLLAALRNPLTRNVSFRWADFCFIGQLKTVQAKYTMFSPSGRPVRAMVTLRLQHEMDPMMLNSWYADVNNAFTPGKATRLTRSEQSYGSLLNIGL